MKYFPKNRLVNLLLKTLVAGLLAWAIYAQVFARQDAEALWESLITHYYWPNNLWFVAVVILSPINIGFEALKFRQLLKAFTHLSFFKTYKAVLSGITIAIFTPNRVGEYGGRILFIDPDQNWKAIIATLVGSLAQLLVILSVGLIGMAYFTSQFLEMDTLQLCLILSLGAGMIALMIFCFFNIDLLIPVAKRLPFTKYIKRYLKHLVVLQNYSPKELTPVLGIAFLRYMTYSFQYYLLLKFFGIEVALLDGLAGIFSIFFVQASIPFPPVMGLLARGEIALQVWGNFSSESVAILGATFSLFVINIAVPALLGLVFIVQTNIMKSLGYENEKGS